MKELLQKLKTHRGKIVSSASCTELEISEAKACNRFYVDEEDFGFVYFPEQNRKGLEERLEILEKKVHELSIQNIVFGPPPVEDNDNDAELQHWIKTGECH